ncbi:type I-Fv CRISPR-associated protein Cas7fv [Acinetobacter sp. YH12239]|uniref:type I-Fv CRISPR-associated protein Cas7fv n=1 Tax=Acinetobacter sp. YH12239 TaxID=2601166 RepID=UPI0015D3D4F6|nr:type I-Fv CRISPR-associated protein Cas7fv [Acinetobacter sp. YH12239]
MAKVTGVKSVDFKITAYGYGVVNWNGPTSLTGNDGKTVDNHTLPKLRGFSNLSGKVKEETGYKYRKEASDIDFKETPLYISQNCIRHHLFRDQSFDLHYAKDKNLIDVVASITGLIRGYVVPSSQCKRTSPLLITDFIDQLGNGNFEQLSNASSSEEITQVDGSKTYKRGENSIFSKTTFGDTEYIAYGSISIEQLQFISLDKKFDRASMIIKEGEGEKIAERAQEFIKSLDPSREPKAIFHKNYVRKGTIFNEGEVGILLDNTAIDILVKETLSMLEELVIKQAKGYMCVDTVEVDYNDSHKMMRIKRNPDQANPEPQQDYAVYFAAQ